MTVTASGIAELVIPGAPWLPATGATRAVVEKATGHELRDLTDATPVDVATAARTAMAAQPGWGNRPQADRAALLRDAAILLRDAADQFTEWLVREGGGTVAKARFEIGETVTELFASAELLGRPHGVLLPGSPSRQSVARRNPLGVVGVISPWNMPLLLAVRAAAPALACGNAVLLKPDPRTAFCGGELLAALFAAAGLPDGVFAVLPGAAAVGIALTENPDVDMIAFTGSSAVGRQVGETTGRLLKRAALELGGNNAYLVLDDADLDAAASAGAWAGFLHSGQVCMAAGRHIAHAAIADDYAARLAARAARLTIGNPWTDPDLDLGPLIDRDQAVRAERLVDEAITAGAKLLCGGERERNFFIPTVLTGVTEDMAVAREEIFAPVIPVLTAPDDESAIRMANNTEYGLVAAIATGPDTRRAQRISERLRTAIVHINDQTIEDNAYVPFGGNGASGNGVRFGAEHNADLFSRWQWITVQDELPRYPF